MSDSFIVDGDSHSHGGHVSASASASRIGGRAVVRKGDTAICNIHGPTQVARVSGRAVFHGEEVARDGDQLACGAALIASQPRAGRPS